HKRIKKSMLTAVSDQENIFIDLIKNGKNTIFGKDHNLAEITKHAEYVEATKILDYEGIKPYIEQIKEGKENVLWKGKPLYFAKTSGTTSGIKYIPISKDSIANHI